MLLSDNCPKMQAIETAGLIYLSCFTLALLSPPARDRLFNALAARRIAGGVVAFDLAPRVADTKGADFDADNAAIAADPVTQEWWSICGPMQKSFKSRAQGEWWAGMEQVFFLE